MSVRDGLTGLHEDDLAAKLEAGTATVHDVMQHAEHIIVAHPAASGYTNARCVEGLLAIIGALMSGGHEDLDFHHTVPAPLPWTRRVV